MTAQFRNIRISISVWFAVVIMLLCIFAPEGSALTGLLCSLAHETGHLIFIKVFGAKVKSLSLGVYGMRIECSGNLKVSHSKEAVISFAGPAVNLLLSLLALTVHNTRLFYINVLLAVFNLLPAGKTDGWNILYNVLIQFIDEKKTETVLKIIGTVFLTVIYFFGILIYFSSGYNFTLLAAAVYITVIFVLR